jgi:hypothetical protein
MKAKLFPIVHPQVQTAHYLVFTHFSETARAAALGMVGDLAGLPCQQPKAALVGPAGTRKRKRMDPQQEHK